ncbi:hypothetical protein [Klenkia brasiliensis]|uniref:Uncharacterized protein n=1 Tax=Klenkia brasiliensis TaxID=333142 RepID=A0A1G7LJA0_9ACTN|nr:hypothetical protein [Klenkia brasiliensis]SDF49019.1 hypothetical protein SAMN05660324_0269 [Klenkia brasiliensis]
MRHSATDTTDTVDLDRTAGSTSTGPVLLAAPAAADRDADRGLTDEAADHLVVHVQLRPRRAAARKCLTALAQLATEHTGVPVSLAGLSKDDRVLRITVAVDLGPRLEVARFSPAAQAAYGFVSDLFTVLYDHMPVYATEPTAEESAVVAPFLRAGDRPLTAEPVWQSEVLGAVSA